MSKSDVTLKVTQSNTFRFKFGFEIPKLFYNKKKFKIKLLSEKFLKLHLSREIDFCTLLNEFSTIVNFGKKCFKKHIDKGQKNF